MLREDEKLYFSQEYDSDDWHPDEDQTDDETAAERPLRLKSEGLSKVSN